MSVAPPVDDGMNDDSSMHSCESNCRYDELQAENERLQAENERLKAENSMLKGAAPIKPLVCSNERPPTKKQKTDIYPYWDEKRQMNVDPLEILKTDSLDERRRKIGLMHISRG